MGYGNDMGAGGWIAMTIFWVALIVLIAWGVTRAHPAGSGGGSDAAPWRGGARDGSTETAENILDRRFAGGELDEASYLSMRATLRSPPAKGSEGH